MNDFGLTVIYLFYAINTFSGLIKETIKIGKNKRSTYFINKKKNRLIL
jgi:hypothetical protein